MHVRHVVAHHDRGAALVVYAIMFTSPFMAGAPMLLASAIAFARKGSADPISRSHFEYQLRTMGKDVVLEVVGAVCLWLAAFGGLAALAGEAPLHIMPTGFDPGRMGLVSLALLLVWLLCWAWAVLSLFLTPAFGAFRLASGRPAIRTRL